VTANALRDSAVDGKSAAAFKLLNELCRSQPHTSFVRENAGGIVIRLFDNLSLGVRVHLTGMSFDAAALRGRSLSDISFERCSFRESSLVATKLRNVQFNDCDFESLMFGDDTVVEDVALDEATRIFSIGIEGSTAHLFDPAEIRGFLRSHGIQVSAERDLSEDASVPEDDEATRLVNRMLRAFLRSTGVNEATCRARLGDGATLFFSDVLPELIRCGVVSEVAYRGAGRQTRYTLSRPMTEIHEALERSGGSFERFIARCRR